jgi:hypothetical protein
MKFCWFCTLLICLCCTACSKSSSKETKTTKNKTSKSSPSYSTKAPGPGSAKRAAFNANGESLSSNSGVDELFVKDLQASDTDKVKDAIEHLQNNGVKSAIPKLEELAKNHKNSDIKRRAQSAVDSLKRRK